MTSREFLVLVAGETHAMHSVVGQSRVRIIVTEAAEKPRRVIKLTCSCGEVFEATATKESEAALKNVPVPEEQS